jgi:hypothetical protein
MSTGFSEAASTSAAGCGGHRAPMMTDVTAGGWWFSEPSRLAAGAGAGPLVRSSPGMS